MLSFQHFEFLFALVLLVPLTLVFTLVLRWKKKVKKELGDPELVDALVRGHSVKNYNSKFLMVLAVFILCIMAAANLRKPMQGEGGERTGIDIMVALDVSNSMLAQDVKPNRLERAKQVLTKMVEEMGDNKMGLVLFAGQAFLQMPLTSDLAAAKIYISNASPAAVPTQGTVIGDALRLCDASLDTKDKKYKAIILISDGEGHDEKAAEAVKALAENGVVLYTVGIGSPQGATIFDPNINDLKRDDAGNPVISKLNEEDLENFARQTGGSYHYFTNADDVVNGIMSSIDQMEKKSIGKGGQRQYTSYFPWFLLAAFVVLILEIFIPESKKKWFS
jgi:Ca-activated chloride channel homolog